ncbi:MAG: putative baseplate assembly protein [Chloroflexi bacterium]|uniref:Baseplate assembly protein n=1 Tax=Candidatus Chlorohelix allophototropha TaxID=3003348 RepID=A0A8T7M395_9CHLR|nr:putative baseplate assembly protein [Chloroflexota bacterium]WJW67438.1 putative baseplate assembly protein [Chloroflexota bacterium L227-S17]
MSLPQIKLDERTFQDLVDEAKLRIPRYCPEWTNHNVSDPGVTLIELFAYMVDQLLYQINRVPEKNYRSFLDMIGVKLAPPNPARTEVTFRLSAPQPGAVIIPKYTEVSTVRTETNEARIFTTEKDLQIVPPSLKYVLTTANSQTFSDRSKMTLDKLPNPVAVFQDEPQPGNAFYLGFSQNISSNTLVVGLDCEKIGVGINPDDAPLIWEYWDEREGDWRSLELMRDTTGGLTVPFAEVELAIPSTAGQHEIELVSGSGDPLIAWWLRCRYRELSKGQPDYNKSPVIRKFSAYTIGGTVPVMHCQIIRMEELGRSSGESGQRFRLRNTPVLALNHAENETIMIEYLDERAPEIWKHVPDFSESDAKSKNFTCDPVTGEVAFGPAIRNPRGEIEQRGAIPPFDTRINMIAYRNGGGIEGNVGSQTLTVLKSSIAYVDSVNNRRPATGGTSAESLEHALQRGPRTLRARNRAVTAEDFEVLTREATSGVARVRCLTPSSNGNGNGNGNGEYERIDPGTVILLVVPEIDPELRELRPEHLNIPNFMRTDILDYLDERRLITTQVQLAIPKYQWVTVQTRIKSTNSFANERIKREAERRLYRFIRPVHGGPDPSMRYETPGEGWPFGRILYLSEIFPILQTIDGVEFVERIQLFPVTDISRGQAGNPVNEINPGARGLLCSYRHQIVFI